MRFAIVAAGMSLILTGSAFAQGRGVLSPAGGARTYGSRSGFGNILFPGTGSAPSLHNPFYSNPTSFAQRLGATVSGYPGYMIGGRQPRATRAPGRVTPARAVAIPYAVPVYYGGHGYAPQPPRPLQVTVQSVPAPQPPVIINQYYTTGNPQPVMRDYTNANLPEPASSTLKSYQAPIPSHPEPGRRPLSEDSEKPTIYLIAYKDQSIYPAVAYWVEGDTLNYVTTHGAHNRASLDLIDEEFSEQLNRERNVEFSLSVR